MKKNDTIITVNPINLQVARIRIAGDSPLIMHRWSEKAKREMFDKMTGKAIKEKGKARPLREPVAEFIDSLYWMNGKPNEKTEAGFEAAIAQGARFGFPVTAIKKAAISAAYRTGKTKDMASIRGAFFIAGEGPEMLTEVHGGAPQMREDMVRIGKGVADIRYRGEFPDWYIDLEIKYDDEGIYTLEHIVNMINIGGFACGIGEFRPEKDGQYGMFHVESVPKN